MRRGAPGFCGLSSELEQVDGFLAHGLVGGVDGGQGLALFAPVAATGMKENARVGIDGFARPFSACPGALHGPAEASGVHCGDKTALACRDEAGGAGAVEGLGGIEDRDIASL